MKSKIITFLAFIFRLIKKTVQEFVAAQSLNSSAAVAFYTIFSLPAVLIIIIFVAGTAFDVDLVRSELFTQIRKVIGAENTVQVREIVKNARHPYSSAWMNVIGIGLLIFSATTVFISLQNALNMLWQIKPKPGNVYMKFILDRLLSFGIVLGFGFIILVFLLIDALFSVVKNYMANHFTDFFLRLMEVINSSASALVIMGIFLLIFKVLPDASLKWKQVWLGAFITTILFILGKYGMNLYLQQSSFTSTYGVAGSFVAILLWIYYTSLLLFLGASFIKAYAAETGNRIRSSQHAVSFKTRKIEKA